MKKLIDDFIETEDGKNFIKKSDIRRFKISSKDYFNDNLKEHTVHVKIYDSDDFYLLGTFPNLDKANEYVRTIFKKYEEI